MECAFRLFRGSAACGDDAAEMVSVLEVSEAGWSLMRSGSSISPFRVARERSVLLRGWRMVGGLSRVVGFGFVGRGIGRGRSEKRQAVSLGGRM